MECENNVVPIDRTTRLHELETSLGSMTLAQLRQAEDEAREQQIEAGMRLQVIREYVATLFPDGPEPAA